MKIQDFDKIFCINLKRRTDRRNECKQIFYKYNLNVKFVDAIDGRNIKNINTIKPGAIGCCLSHKKIYENIKSNESLKKCLILEDDVEFHHDFLDLFQEWYKEVPEEWGLLYFGGNHNGLDKNFISSHVHKLSNTFTTHCYAVNRKIIDELLYEFNDKKIFNHEADIHLSNIQKKNPCYGFFPHLAWQRNSFSDIEMKNKNYDFLR